MKRILFAFFIISILITGCDSKPSFDTEKLIGKWKTSETEKEDGVKITTVLILEFLNESEVILTGKFFAMGEYMGQLEANGSYKVSGDKLKLKLSESDFKVTLSSLLFDSSDEKAFKKEMMSELFDDSGTLESRVISVSEEFLVMEEEGDIVEYKRID